MKKPLILVFGANPAWQKTLYFQNFRRGEVNRAYQMECYASGKGVNFCRAVKCNGTADVVLYQFSGGVNGQLHEQALQAEAVECHAVHIKAETRCCITLLDSTKEAMTELIEPSHAPSEAEIATMLRNLDLQLPQVQGLAITGSLPDGTDKELYTEVVKMAVKHKVPLLVDAIYAPMLDAAEKFILKINLDELKKLTGEKTAKTALLAAISRWKRSIFAITDGGAGAYLVENNQIWQYTIPAIEVVSALGSGDTCSAVMFSEFLNGKSAKDAFAYGLAAASANCLTARAGYFDNGIVAKLMPGVRLSD